MAEIIQELIAAIEGDPELQRYYDVELLKAMLDV